MDLALLWKLAQVDLDVAMYEKSLKLFYPSAS